MSDIWGSSDEFRFVYRTMTGDGYIIARVASIENAWIANSEVRAALLLYQRDFAKRPEGAVLDGRDIGTVVCPEADVKL